MTFWPLLWTIVLFAAVGLFAALTVVVTIGGAFDIRQMLKTLGEEHNTQGRETDSQQ